MTDKPFDVRGEIMSAIAKTNDEERRVHLMLMLGVLERVEKLLDDEASLQAKVLNGVMPHHKSDHDLIAQLRGINLKELCDWTQAKKLAEEEAQKTKKGLVITALNSFAAEIPRALITGGIAVAGALWVIK